MIPDGSQFHIEYYAPIATEGDRRDIQFVLPANYISADNAAVEIVLPPTAGDIAFDPVATSAENPQSQGHVLMREIGLVTADQTIDQRISYTNESGAFTFSEQPLPAAPATNDPLTTPPAVSTTSNNSGMLIGLAGLAVLLIAAGAYGLWRTRSSHELAGEHPNQTPGRGKRSKKERKQKGGAGQDRFCRKCGAEFSSGDRFCRQCGDRRL
jgi:hypothetical protein